MPDATLHVRAQIRQAAADQLVAMCATVGGRVFSGRATSLSESELPCLLVYTPSETVTGASIGRSAIQDRRIVLQVVAVATSDTDVSAELDALACQVEQALLAPGALNPAGRHVALDGTTQNFDVPSSEIPAGQSVMSFTVSTYTTVGSPTEPR